MRQARRRSCCVCGRRIRKGEQFAIVNIPKEKTAPYLALAEVGLELATRMLEDAEGNLRLNVCFLCHLIIMKKCGEDGPVSLK